MKLNNKGFAISTVMYMILIMAIVLITLTLTLLSSRKLILDKAKDESKDNIYGVFALSYRQVLEILKNESIEYAITNNVEKDSIMISNLNSSIDKEILDGYKLSDKYLTMINNDSYYDVYLGKSKTVTNLDESIDNLIDIVDYKIYGNSYQDTRSGKNLFDASKIKNTQIVVENNGQKMTMPISESGVGNVSAATSLSNLCPNLNVGDEVILSFNTNSTHNYIYLYGINIYWGNGETQTITQEMLDSTVVFYGNNYNQEDYEQKIITNFQIEKGSTVTDYEEYGAMPSLEFPSEVQSVGDLVTDSNDPNYGRYKIDIQTIGKNLFDINNPNKSKSLNTTISNLDNGFKYTSTSNSKWSTYVSYALDFDEISGKTITLSADFNLSEGNTAMMRIGYWKDSYASFKSSNTDMLSIKENGRYEITYVVPETMSSDAETYAIFFNTSSLENSSGMSVEVSNIQLEISDTSTDYEPYIREKTSIYLDEPLRCAGTYCDYIYLAENEISRSVGIYNFNVDTFDDITFTNYGVTTNNDNLYRHYITFKIAPKLKGTRTPGFTNILPSNKQGWNNWTYEQAHFGQANTGIYVVIEKECANVTDLYNYLSNNGTVEPYFIYPLSEVGKNSIELPKILTGLGYNSTISIDTEIQPSNIEFTVIQKIKQI